MMKVDKTKENMKKCICMECPSYTFMCKIKSMPANVMAKVTDVAAAEHVEGMFCAFGKSACIEENKGCICGNCLLFREYSLKKGYFCLG